MALLDMQGMEQPRWQGEGSDVSLLLCDSTASVLLCL
jgi:SapB morphogen precursor RamS